MEQERDRLRFLEATRGRAAAREFAARTMSGYRRAVVRRSAPAGERLFRLRLTGSYCYLKQYLKGTSSHQLQPTEAS
ncbi:hypothetical protein [Arhodomonas sp. SL1]|uniref:hypothetical protein n=1 Tax=Arhodomonas sp. SL1 TaxID=3425691 RepID=UPI003F880F2B